MKIKRNSS